MNTILQWSSIDFNEKCFIRQVMNMTIYENKLIKTEMSMKNKGIFTVF